jgi:hypothetical protein
MDADMEILEVFTYSLGAFFRRIAREASSWVTKEVG